MLHRILASLATLALLASAPAHAGPLVDVGVVDRNTGEWLAQHPHRGDLWVAGTPGNRYSVRLTNTTGERVLVVLSVDGINAITALTYPKRVPGVVPELDFTTLKLLTFDVADEETFRCLAACKKAIRKGGLGPCAANGANEEAVKLFLEDKIGFLDIGRLVEAVVDSDSFGGDYTLADVYECDRMARAFVQAHL